MLLTMTDQYANQPRNLVHKPLVREHLGPQSSQLAQPLWTDPGKKSGISVYQLISIKKKERSFHISD